MRSIVFAVLVTVSISTAAAAQDLVAKGAPVFSAQKCSICHSIAGKGNPKGSLDGVGTKLKAEEIRLWITDSKGMTAKMKTTRKPDMKQYTLAADDVDALVAYLGSLKK